MKSALILTPTHAIHGGVEAIVSDLSRQLPSRGWRVVLGLMRGAKFNIPEQFLQAHPGVEFLEVDGSAGTSEGRVQAIIRAVRRLQPDLLFSARVYEGFEAARRLKRERRPLRFGLTIQAYESDYLSDLLRWRDQVDLCVTSGELVRQAAEEICGLEPARLVSIPGGVGSPEVCYRDFKGPLRIGYAGRIDQKQKRIGDVVEIAQNLRERGLRFTLAIAGTGPDEPTIIPKLRNLLAADFLFHGWIGDPSQLARFYAGLDIFLHTAGHEGVTIAPREAMAAGVVPVASEFLGLWTEGHFRPGKNCLTFPVGNIEAAAQQIAGLDADRGRLYFLSAQAAGSQCGVYSFSGALDAWSAAFDRCLEMPSKPSPARSPAAGADPGRLARFGIPPSLAQQLRDLVGRKPLHANGGDEFPHAGPPPDPDFEIRLREFAATAEQNARQHYFESSPA